ncbi:uncharacterized protein [Aristolochia californica]|uniref:uncharacterized protein n=1 Tax=Aristolochia californica TaxID=171875 RepID=UPI0035DA3D48
MAAILICSTQSPKSLQTGSPLTDSGKNQLRASQSVGLRSPLHFPKSKAQSWLRSTRRLTIKNQEDEIEKREETTISTTPTATFKRLFTDHDFLIQAPKQLSKNISAYKENPRQIKNICMEIIKTGHLKEAEDLLREWRKIDQYQHSLETMLAETLLYQGKYQEVVDLPPREAAPSDTLLLLKAVACALISDSYNEESTKWWVEFKQKFQEKGPFDEAFSNLLNENTAKQSTDKLHEYTTKLNDLIARKVLTKENEQTKDNGKPQENEQTTN